MLNCKISSGEMQPNATDAASMLCKSKQISATILHAWSAHLLVVAIVEDARQASNAYTTKFDDPSVSQVENVGRNPASVIQLPKIVHGFMVATNCTAGLEPWLNTFAADV